jgi:hypothetical protein
MWHGRIVAGAALAAAGTALWAAEAPGLSLSSHASGATARHEVWFAFEAGEPEIHAALLTYPEGFRCEGFEGLGPAGTVVGRYELDVNFDGVAERTSALIARGPDVAWVDLHPDGVFTEAFEPVLRRRGLAAFELGLPRGGDVGAGTLAATFDGRVRLALFEGLLVNPPLGGAYTVVAETVSVDPDTGGGDDGRGASPETRRFELPLSIVGPVVAPFAHLEVDKLAVKTSHHGRARFKVRGRYVPGVASDGIDLAEENVTVAFDGFYQTLPGSAFAPTGHGYHLRGTPPGIEDFRLWDDGRFQIDGRDLAPIATRPVVTFVLSIGNDRGEASVVPDDGRGHGQR